MVCHHSGYMIHYILKGKGIYKTNGRFTSFQKVLLIDRIPSSIMKRITTIHGVIHGLDFRDQNASSILNTSLLEHPCFHYDKDDRVRLCHEKCMKPILS